MIGIIGTSGANGPSRVTGAQGTISARCGACGSRRVRLDAVEESGGLLHLAECAHCDHRWTRREEGVPAARAWRVQPARVGAAGVADAA